MSEKMLAEWFWIERWEGSSAALLPMEAQGIYRAMLSHAWRRGAKLPVDKEEIRLLIRCREKEWNRSWHLVEKYWREEGGFLVNDTQREVYAEQEQRHARAQARSQAGAQASAQARREKKLKQSHPYPYPVVTDNVIPPTTGSTARDPLPPEPKRRDDVGDLAEARSALTGALATARQRRPELADLTDQAILDRPEYHAPSGRVRLDSPNAKLLHATAAKLRATKSRKTSAPAWDRPDTSEAGLDAEAAAWIADHWPEDCDPASRDDLRSLLECLSPPASLAGRIEVQLRFTRYPALYLDAPSAPDAEAWIAANWPAEFAVATREDLASELKRRGCPAEQRSAVIAALSARYEFRDAA